MRSSLHVGLKTPAGRIALIVDDSERVREEVRRVLVDHGLFERILEADSGIAALKLLKTAPVDLILCDVIMPNVDGFKFLHMIRERPEYALLPVIMLTGQEDVTAKVRGFGAGASDYLTKPFHSDELVARVRVHLELKRLRDELAATNVKLEELSATDPLTKLRNRSHLLEVFATEYQRAARYDTPLAFIMVDIDGLSTINDEHGRLAGDKVLQWAARLLREGMREHDLLARYGDEEFGVLLPHTPLHGGRTLAERFRKTLQANPVRLGKGELEVTASFGVAAMPSVGVVGYEDLIRLAEESLSKAKGQGRNQVCVGG